jgi:electron transfer flavoprotein beta subunit
MIILVCIKQVPDTASKFKVADNDVWYDTADLAWRMNDYDEYAVEQAIQLKEQVKETDITVLSIGPARVQKSIKKALAMGCDRGAYLADDDAAGKEPFEIAGIIAE